MSARAAVILAAGKGERMKSPIPKVLHAVGGRAMIDHVIDTARALGCERVVVVTGAHAPAVTAHVSARMGEAAIAVQDPPLGTGHAVLAAREALAGFLGDILVTFADVPLLTVDSVEPLFGLRVEGADVAILGFTPADARAYGRLVLDDAGALSRIVEARDATAEELAITTCNSGVLVASAPLLFDLLGQVRNENARGEYYLTDVVGLATRAGRRVSVAFAAEETVAGVDSQAMLAAAEAAFQSRRRAELMEAGVTMPAPSSVHLAWDTRIAAGATIEPYVVFAPGVTVETGAVIRAFSHLEGAVVRAGALIGPYARLRPGADIGAGAHIGNFVEVKKVKVGPGAKANHLAYLGDGVVGAGRTSAPGRSSATMTASTNSRPTSEKAPSSAPTPPWWRRSPSARGPTPGPGR